jgi:hypothetical protein
MTFGIKATVSWDPRASHKYYVGLKKMLVGIEVGRTVLIGRYWFSGYDRSNFVSTWGTLCEYEYLVWKKKEY